jgi:hypothetical protein
MDEIKEIEESANSFLKNFLIQHIMIIKYYLIICKVYIY